MSFFGSLISGIGSLFGANKAAKVAREQIHLQDQALRHGIEWRVLDAQKAGVHPLYALGANLNMPSPITSGAPDLYAQAGQQFGNAVSSYENRKTQKLQNDLLQAQIDKQKAEADYIMQQANASKLRMLHSTLTGVGKPRPATLPGHKPVENTEMTTPEWVTPHLKINPSNLTSADTLEQNHGDVAGGILTLLQQAYMLGEWMKERGAVGYLSKEYDKHFPGISITAKRR